MTRSKAADIASALTNIGIAVTVIPSSSGDVNSGWFVRVHDAGGHSASEVATFATANGVQATIVIVEFS